MGAQISKQVDRRKALGTEKKTLAELQMSAGDAFPGSEYKPDDRKTWMKGLDPSKLVVNQIVWPGTHDSATNKIGVRFVSRPFAQCQNCSIYRQLCKGTRVLDIRVEENRRVCHGILKTYSVAVVIDAVKRFLSETDSEIIILEIRTEFGHNDPPEFDKYLIDSFRSDGGDGDLLIHNDDSVFSKTVAEILPRRVICVWKPNKTPPPPAGAPLWSSGYLRDNWTDTDLPSTKFDNNIKYLSQQPPASDRRYFYRVENTATPRADNPVVCVKPVTERIHPYARLFISQAFARGVANRLQIFSTDFIGQDFVDACVALTRARLEAKA